MQEKYDLADGHAALPCAVDALPPTLMSELQRTPQRQLEDHFTKYFDEVCGDPAPASGTALVPTASQALAAVAAYLARQGRTSVGLIEPTFDSLSHTLSERGLTLHPVAEDDDAVLAAVTKYDAVLLVVPNNPTGWSPSASALRQLPALAAASGCLVVIDRTFRFYQEDLVSACLAAEGFDWITIDDTGKTWSTVETKVSLLRSNSARILSDLRRITEMSFLLVPPLNLYVTAEAIRHEKGPRRAREAAAANGALLTHHLQELGFTSLSRPSGLALFRLPADAPLTAAQLTDELLADGVAILPGSQFYWATPNQGEALIRVALVRPLDYFENAVEAMRRGLRRCLRT